MKQRVLTTLLLTCFLVITSTFEGKAQNNFLSINVTHPIPIGDTFYSGFHGVGGLDVKYGQPVSDFLNLSGSLGYLRSRYTGNERITMNMYRAGLGVNTSLKITPRTELRPGIDIGYVIMRFHFETVALQNQNSDYHNLEGIDINGMQSAFSLSYLYTLNEKISLGVTTGYEFIRILRERYDQPYDQQMHSIGVSLKALINL